MRTDKILLVDDRPENLEVIVDIIENSNEGYEVLQALNAKLALRIAQEESPDLIVTDWEMPGMSGIELIEALKKDEDTKDIPVIACTGLMTSSKNLETALDAGAVDFIRKPVDEVELMARLRSMLQLSDSMKAIKSEQKKTDALLLSILPEQTAKELKHQGYSEPRHYQMATVLFTDFIGFTSAAAMMSPQELIMDLSECFSAFDEIVSKHNMEKIKTIGDSYMCAGGIPEPNESNPLDAVNAAYEMRRWVKTWNKLRVKAGKQVLEVRIGIHTGEIVAGVIGHRKFQYDVWGDSVNIASRMENNCGPGEINVSASTYEHIKQHYDCEDNGVMETRDGVKISMYKVVSVKGEERGKHSTVSVGQQVD